MKRNWVLAGGILFLLIAFIVTTEPVLAHHKQRVLGESTQTSELVVPPVTSGTGYILPDSPLFLVDRTFQAVRLVTAFSAERRAKVHNQIAGERLAELRVMLDRNNQDAVAVVLADISSEMNGAARELSLASAEGKDTKALARSLNDTIKAQREFLASLQTQTTGSLELAVKTARRALQEAKVEVEDNLPEEELAKEIEEGLNAEIADRTTDAASATDELEIVLTALEKEASEAARKAIAQKETDLAVAMKSGDEKVQKEQELALRREKSKQEILLRVHREVASEARASIKNAKQAVAQVKKAQQTAQQVKNNASTVVLSDTDTSTKSATSEESKE